MRKIDTIVVHCAYTKPSMDIGVKEITKWHTDPKPKGNGWSAIGYHYVIRRDGTVEDGRPNQQIGAHAKGNNRHSLGICLVGGMTQDGKTHEFNFTKKQMTVLVSLIDTLMLTYGVPQRRVVGHRDLAPGRACPCFDVQEELFG